MTSASFVVPIINDSTREDIEEFMLIIDSSSVSVGDPDQAMVAITDSDGKYNCNSNYTIRKMFDSPPLQFLRHF